MMLAFKGRNPFHRYVPRKPHANGTKLHALCDSHHYYLMRFIVDDNISRTVPEIAAQVLKDVVEPGQIIVTDRWYTCKGLVRLCLKERLGFVGTTKGNVFLGRRALPGWGKDDAKERARGAYECAVNSDETVCCICWRDGSTVKLTTTAANNMRVYMKRKKRDVGEFIVTAPLAIQVFYMFFHGCDRSDQMRGPGYGVVLRFRARKYTVKFFMGAFDMALANVWVLWVYLHPKDRKQHRRWFLDLADTMLHYGRPHGWVPGADADPMTQWNDEHKQRKFKQGKKYDCAVCSQRSGNPKDRKRTVTGCMKCMVALCSDKCRSTWHGWNEAERKSHKKRRCKLDFAEEAKGANDAANVTDSSDSDYVDVPDAIASDSDSDSDSDSSPEDLASDNNDDDDDIYNVFAEGEIVYNSDDYSEDE